MEQLFSCWDKLGQVWSKYEASFFTLGQVGEKFVEIKVQVWDKFFHVGASWGKFGSVMVQVGANMGRVGLIHLTNVPVDWITG